MIGRSGRNIALFYSNLLNYNVFKYNQNNNNDQERILTQTYNNFLYITISHIFFCNII